MFMLPARTVTQPKPVSVLCQFLQADETVCLQLPFYPFDSVHAILFFLFFGYSSDHGTHGDWKSPCVTVAGKE